MLHCTWLSPAERRKATLTACMVSHSLEPSPHRQWCAGAACLHLCACELAVLAIDPSISHASLSLSFCIPMSVFADVQDWYWHCICRRERVLETCAYRENALCTLRSMHCRAGMASARVMRERCDHANCVRRGDCLHYLGKAASGEHVCCGLSDLHVRMWSKKYSTNLS